MLLSGQYGVGGVDRSSKRREGRPLSGGRQGAHLQFLHQLPQPISRLVLVTLHAVANHLRLVKLSKRGRGTTKAQ